MRNREISCGKFVIFHLKGKKNHMMLLKVISLVIISNGKSSDSGKECKFTAINT